MTIPSESKGFDHGLDQQMQAEALSEAGQKSYSLKSGRMRPSEGGS